jgi:HD-like signal output (HDOD) protein
VKTAEGTDPGARPTTAAVIQELVEQMGGPVGEVDTQYWHRMAKNVIAQGQTVARPPSAFPLVASQMVQMLRDPALDLNKLVGTVQRDAGIASALLKLANSPIFAPAVAVTSLRGAIQSLGVRQVGELVIANAGKSLYDTPSKHALEMYPTLWKSMFQEAMANAFTAGRLALDVRGGNSEIALIAGLLVDAGRPIGLQVLCELVKEGMNRPNELEAIAVLDEVAPALGGMAVAKLELPAELASACSPDSPSPTVDGQIARLVTAVGAIQRRTPRIWSAASDVVRLGDQIGLSPYQVRAQFGQRTQYLARAAAFSE